MSRFLGSVVLLALTLAVVTSVMWPSRARAADLPVKAKAKPVVDLPFFLVIDDRVTFSWIPTATDPSKFILRPDGSIDGKTSKQVYSFTHFDAWAYGTNFFTVSVLNSDHNGPSRPCVNAGVLSNGSPADCAGAAEVYGVIRSTFGRNEIFDTKPLSMGPLRNISIEIGADAETENLYLAPAKRDLVAGLQFALDLSYKGCFDVAPLAYKDINHNTFDQCGLFGPGVGGVTCLADCNVSYKTAWALETNYYMDLGFPPENLQYFSISGRTAWYGPKGDQDAPLSGAGLGRFSTATVTEFNSEPIWLTFGAGKVAMGPKYLHFMDLWVAYRYWQNKFGLDHNASPGVCTVAATGQSTNSCTESSIYSGITMNC